MDNNVDQTQDSTLSVELINLGNSLAVPVPPVQRSDHESAVQLSSSVEDNDKDNDGVTLDHSVMNPVTSKQPEKRGRGRPRGSMSKKCPLKPSTSSEQDVFFVEKIIGYRRNKENNDREEAFIKWKGYDETHDTWEPVANLNDIALGFLQIFKEKQEQEQESNDTEAIRMGIDGTNLESQPEPVPEPEVPSQEAMDNISQVHSNVEVTALDDPKKEFDTIMGMTEREGELCFLIAFKVNGQDPCYEVIPTRIANLKIPFQVIDYYEGRVCYNQNN